MYSYIATSAFGLEAPVKREAAALGFGDISVLDGRVGFTGDISAIPRANIWLRCADRVLLIVGEFNAYSFDELFEKTKALPWDEWITPDGKFTVTGKSIRSQLYSVPDCQSIVKKAVVEKLKLKYKKEWFEETGPEYKIQVALLKDMVTLTIDTTGPGLHKRGYRGLAMDAPLKETMAAALIELSYWKKERIFMDPVCGSGTIPIEAALIAKNIAPGISRRFVSEKWPQIDSKMWKDERAAAYASICQSFEPEIYGSDIDPAAIELAKSNAAKAGVEDCVRFETKPLKNVTLSGSYGVAVCNPPYAERMGDIKEVEDLYRDMGRIFGSDTTWSFYTMTTHEGFEKLFGRKADAKRKLFNGTIKTDYYQFYGKRPPKNEEKM